MSAPQGLSAAVNRVASYGRGPDTSLAHMSPDEMKVIDYLQGGRKVNPHTGLPEYGLFGDIMKSLVRVGASVGGFMVGGPAGAAAGSGIATKLTGGSWDDALKGAALSGIGGEIGQGVTGGGWNPLGGSAANAASSAAGAADPTIGAEGGMSQIPGAAGGMSAIPTQSAIVPGATVASAAAPTGLTAGIGNSLSAFAGAPVNGAGAMYAGLGSLGTPLQQIAANAPLPKIPDPGLPTPHPLARTMTPYQGTLTQYGQAGQGGEHRFFDDINPQPQMLARGGAVRRYDAGGPVQPQIPGVVSPQVMSPQSMPPGVIPPGVRSPIIMPQGVFPGAAGSNGTMPANLMGPGAVMPGQQSPGNFGPTVQQLRAALMQQMPAGQPPAQYADGGNVGLGGVTPQIAQAAAQGYAMPVAKGGAIHGPGDGKSDEVPAMLSPGEHVWDAQTVSMAGNGDNAAGQRAVERIKTEIRRRAGLKNPSKPSKSVGTLGSLLKAAA